MFPSRVVGIANDVLTLVDFCLVVEVEVEDEVDVVVLVDVDVLVDVAVDDDVDVLVLVDVDVVVDVEVEDDVDVPVLVDVDVVVVVVTGAVPERTVAGTFALLVVAAVTVAML